MFSLPAQKDRDFDLQVDCDSCLILRLRGMDTELRLEKRIDVFGNKFLSWSESTLTILLRASSRFTPHSQASSCQSHTIYTPSHLSSFDR